MRQPICRLSALTLVLLLLAGCGATIQPRVGSGGTDRIPGPSPESQPGPRSAPALGDVADGRSLIDQICRTRPMPSGWIALRYTTGGENCPASTDPENPYTVAVIERYSHKPVGATMVVCADQAVPRDWARERSPGLRAECPGARVRADAPTVFVIRRIR